MRKYGCGSVPVLALHCQPPLFEARSPSMNCCIKCCNAGKGVFGLWRLEIEIKEITYPLTKTPIDHEILRQVHCGNHAGAIMHPACSGGIPSQPLLSDDDKDIAPIVLTCRTAASTMGTPVRPDLQASKCSGFDSHCTSAYFAWNGRPIETRGKAAST